MFEEKGQTNRPGRGARAKAGCSVAIALVLANSTFTTDATAQVAGQQFGSLFKRRTTVAGQETGLVIETAPEITATTIPPQRSYYERLIDPVGGLTADDLVKHALAHNGELTAVRRMIDEARGKLRQAGLRANPMLEAANSQALSGPDKTFRAGAELPLELGGRRSARVSVAQREIELRQAEVAEFERRLAAEVRVRYASAIAAARNLKATEDLLTLTRDAHRIVHARVERGKSAPLEQNLLMVELNRSDAMRIGIESRAEVAFSELRISVGLAPSETLRLRGEFTTDRPLPILTEATTHALAKRPDLEAARAAERLAGAQVEQMRTEGKVDASIFAEYMRQRMGFDVRGIDEAGRLTPIDSVFHFATFGVRLTLPVRNRNQGNLEAAVASAEAAKNRREFAENVVKNEVAAAYARYERAQAALNLFRDGVRDQALRNVEVIRQTYVLGQKTVLDYLSEQRRFIEVETAYTEVLKEYFESLVEIEKAAASPLPSA
jgi:cobalt-zinc-cadmium efflux system outer membrane protein